MITFILDQILLLVNQPNWTANYPSEVPHEIDPNQYQNLIVFLEQCVADFGDLPAFENMGQEISYRKLDLLSSQFASYLQNFTSLAVGDRVALQMPNVLQYPVALFGILKAGLIVVNTNPQYKPSEMKHQFIDAEAKAIVILNTFAYKLEEILAATSIKTVIIAEVGDLLGSLKGTVVDFMIKRVKKMVPNYHLPEAVKFSDAIQKGKKKSYSRPNISNKDVAILQYTGGTTGVSKGATLTHYNLIANIEQTAAWMKPKLKNGEEITICALPLYHVFALMVNCFGMMRIGAKNILITDPRNMQDFIRTLKNHPFTVITGVNTLFNGLVNRREFAEVNTSRLKVAVAGGMALQHAVAEKWKAITGNQIVEGYGLSETSPLLCCNPINGGDKIGTIGLPVSSTTITIRDDDGKEKTAGDFGEIWAKGPQVMSGYWQRPDESAQVMQDGWFKTGDIAFFDVDGYLKIVDRKKELILVGGLNVYPSEVEEVIADIPTVEEVGVVGIPNKKSGEMVMAFVVTQSQELLEEQIMKHCRDHLSAYKMPRAVHFVSELPKSNVGKILRRELKAQYMERDTIKTA